MATPLSPVIDCTDFVAAEGRYELLQDMYLEQVLPHPVIPTHVSSVSVKYKDYFNNSNNAAHIDARAHHGKQTSADSTLSNSNIDRLEERLRDFKLRDERFGDTDDASAWANSTAGGDTHSKNFHGNLVDLPLYQDDLSGSKTPRNDMMSPGLPHVQTPGPPPLKDSSGSNRQSDPYAQYGPPPSMPHQHPQLQERSSSFRSLSRANSHYSQDEGSQSSSTAGSSAGFSSLFGGKRKKPKNNIAKTNSTFVSKIATNENLAKILANRMNEDVYIFWNTGRTFTWSDLNQKPNVSNIFSSFFGMIFLCGMF